MLRVILSTHGLHPLAQARAAVITPGQRFDLEVRMEDDAPGAQFVAMISGAVGSAVEDRDFTLAEVTFEGEVEPRPAWVAPSVTLPSTGPMGPLTRSWVLSGRVVDAGGSPSTAGRASGTGATLRARSRSTASCRGRRCASRCVAT